jgi:hypothetical protein
MFSSQCKNI